MHVHSSLSIDVGLLDLILFRQFLTNVVVSQLILHRDKDRTQTQTDEQDAFSNLVIQKARNQRSNWDKFGV